MLSRVEAADVILKSKYAPIDLWACARLCLCVCVCVNVLRILILNAIHVLCFISIVFFHQVEFHDQIQIERQKAKKKRISNNI